MLNPPLPSKTHPYMATHLSDIHVAKTHPYLGFSKLQDPLWGGGEAMCSFFYTLFVEIFARTSFRNLDLHEIAPKLVPNICNFTHENISEINFRKTDPCFSFL